MKPWEIIILIFGILGFVYFMGRALGQGIMDGINHKINQFHKSKKDKEE